MTRARLIAVYLPHYHPIPENDAWWGPGFTDWRNVARARALFPGHDQPHVPSELGEYDLRDPAVRAAQADLARAYGIHGFCYYHYWFEGRRLLERPFDEVLATGQPDFPFCLCWANEPWSRRWDGLAHDVLMRQTYSRDDDLVHIRWLLHAFADPRYITIDGRPVLIVYRAASLPDPIATTDLWREEACKAGLPGLFLCRVEGSLTEQGDPRTLGFDAAIEFHPGWASLGRARQRERRWWVLRSLGIGNPVYGEHRVYEYRDAIRQALAETVAYPRFRSVMTTWDNSARRKHDAAIFVGSTPEAYERWLAAVIADVRPRTPGENLLFVNAWNEWAEGAHLEPCRRWGRAYLEATARVLGAPS
jgi:lipopolysaccharide biosynthesis protein